MAVQHLVSTKSVRWPALLGSSGRGSAQPVHLIGMETTAKRQAADRLALERVLDPVVTMSQLASQLGVSVQTLYDLRCQGRALRGFRLGRELRFRVGEVDSWLAQLEADDAERHTRAVG